MGRKNRMLKGWSVIVFIVVTLFSPFAFAKYSGGTGDTNDPYLIATPEDLNDIGNHTEDFNKCFLLVNDINMASYPGTQFKTIGYYSDISSKPFTGIFDGNGHTISNLNVKKTSYCGLFGYMTYGTIMHLTLIDPNIIGTVNHTGPLIGWLLTTTNQSLIYDCHVKGGNIKVSSIYGIYAGGLIGRADGACQIFKCSAETNVSGGSQQVGGLIGTFRSGGEMSQCYSASIVNSTDGGSGGLIGSCAGITVSDSYSTGSVSGTSGLGGLVGFAPSSAFFVNCYSATIVSGSGGGFIGQDNNDSTYTNCFWDVNVNPTLPGVGDGNRPGVFGKTTDEMQTKSTFTDAGWDFVWETVNGPNDIWAICEGVSYPKLAWEFKVGDLDNNKDVDFIDFATLGNKWLQSDSTLYCGGTDLTGNGVVNFEDLDAFVENWLQ